MRPEVLIFLIPIFGILLGMLAVWTKHKEKMARIQAGRDGSGGERNARTLELLTDTLEREHERLVQLQQRVDQLESVVEARPARRLASPSTPADDERSV
jgi:hypothetical protein